MSSIYRNIERITTALWPIGLTLWLLLITTWLKVRLPILGQETPFLMYFAVVGAAALTGGLRLGIVATIASAVAAHIFFLEPGHPSRIGFDDQLKLGLFMLECVLLAYVIERERRVSRRHRVTITELESTR